VQLDLTVLTKTKEMIHYYELFRYGGKNALNIDTNDLTHVSVPIEEDHNSHQPSHMPLWGQHSHAQSCP
jgi:hypothetical protein